MECKQCYKVQHVYKASFNKDIRSWDFTKVWNYVGYIGSYCRKCSMVQQRVGDFLQLLSKYESKFLNTEDSEIQNKTVVEKSCMYINGKPLIHLNDEVFFKVY